MDAESLKRKEDSLPLGLPLAKTLAKGFLHILWKWHLRVSRGTFDYICGIVALGIQCQNTCFQQVIPIQK